MSLTITPYISKSGQTAYFFALAAGVLQPITGIASLPTISVNGTAVQTWGPVWSPTQQVLPWAAWQLASGTVRSLIVTAGGSGYTAPTVTATGCVFGAPVLSAGAITSIPVVSSTSNHTAPPTITITDSTGSGAAAVAVMSGPGPTDTVLFSAAAGWIVTGAGNAPTAVAAPVANYAGQLEPGIGGYLGFGMPATPSLEVGWNVSQPISNAGENYNISANWLHRGNNPWTGAFTSAPDGLPLTITGTASTPISNCNGSNQVDANNYPDQTGTWTLIADDAAPGLSLSMMTPAWSSNGNAVVTPLGTAGLVSAGTLSGGVQTGRVWQWTVARSGSAISWNLSLGLQVNTPGASGTYPFTLQNMWLYDPATTAAAAPGYPSRSNLYLPDETLVKWCTTPHSGAASLRFVDSTAGSGGLSNVVDPPDILSPTSFSWAARPEQTINPTGDHVVNITAVRTYAPSSSGWPAWTASAVEAIVLTAGGSGYVSPVVTITGTGSLATATATAATVNSVAGVITSITLTAGGSGYTSPPTVAITDSSGPGSGATAVALVLGGPVTWSSPNVQIAAWGNTAGVPIGQIQVCTGGTGYTSPSVAVTGGGGSGCTASATVAAGVITGITVTAAGTGYTTAPTVVITDSTGTGAYAAARGQFSPADPGWLNWGGSGSPWMVGEFVCSSPHNLSSGQIMNITGGSTPWLTSNGTSNVIPQWTNWGARGLYGLQVWPTSTTTLAFTTIPGGLTTSTGMPGGINNVAGSFTVSYTGEVPVPDPAVTPHEVAATLSATIPDCDHWVNVPTYATDAAVASIAQRIRDNFPKGRRVYVEYSNENWNFTFSQIYTSNMGQVGALGNVATGNPDPYVIRASQIHGIFVSVFNQTDINGNTNRGGEIVHLFGGWVTQATRTSQIINFANAWNTPLAGGTQPCANATLLGSGTPSIVDQSDSTSYELGVRFQSSAAGLVTGVRFYKCANNIGTHVGNLWDSSGTNLATVTFANETASGWQQMLFPSPVAIAANTTYTVSYYDPNHGHYSKDAGYFASPVTNGDLTALASSNGGNGVYHAGSSAFPTSNGSANYWVDVMFSPSTGPTVIQFGPVSGATSISVSAPMITATFDEPVQPGTISFVLTDSGSNVISSTVSYDSGTLTATLTPTVTLAGFMTYTATVSGAEDLSNNAMVAPLAWSFTTLSSVPIQVDAVCVAPYMDLLQDVWPNPSAAATVNVTGGGSSGGLLTAGTYYAAYTWIDSLTGTETAIGSSRSAKFTVVLGDIPTVTIAALPAWASSASIYLTPADGATGTEVRYTTGVTALVSNLAVANAGTVPLPLVSQLPSSQVAVGSLACAKATSIVPGWPTPWFRGACWDLFRHTTKYNFRVKGWFDGHNAGLAAYSPVGSQPGGFVPALVGYEGGVEACIGGSLETGAADVNGTPNPSGGFYLSNQVTHDMYYDTEAGNGALAVFELCQQNGMSLLTIFNLCDSLASGGGYFGDEMWGNVTWAGQPAGRGDGSLTTGTVSPSNVTNKYWLDDGRCHHLDNAAVLLQAARDWIDAGAGGGGGLPGCSPLSGGRSRSLNVLPAHDATAVRRVRWEA